MTIDEFVNELSTELFKDNQAHLEVGSMVRIYRGDYLHNGHLFCPLTYLAFRKSNQIISTADYEEAAEILGLDILDAEEIVNAADDCCNPDYDIQEKLRNVKQN